jgi:ribosomal protein L37AE/L43A
MLEVLHLRPTCAGRWKADRAEPYRVWRCSGCGAAFVDSPEIAKTAARENTVGDLLERLALEGSRIERVTPFRNRRPRWR